MSRIFGLEPVFDARSKVLILGSMPSVRSLAGGFYYLHPQNRFWKVLAALFGEEVPAGIPEKRAFALEKGIALWDVFASCEREGSSDAAIRRPLLNDLDRVLKAADIRGVFANGQTAFAALQRARPDLTARCLPSTSAQNTRFDPVPWREILAIL